MYFIVGRATEGGPSPYHLAIAGITIRGSEPHWGKTEEVAADSGYSIGAIQVDLGKRGTWPLGATKSAPLKAGELTYVDALIAEAGKYAEDHHLPFAADKAKLRAQLLSHGDGKRNRSALSFIDRDTRDSFNAWAGSEDGTKWIHTNIDYPQIRNATKQALDMVDSLGRNIPDSHRLETVAILMKTANQRPAELREFRDVLTSGGNYDDVLAKAKEIARRIPTYAAVKAADTAGKYLDAYSDPEKAAALDRAQAKVAYLGFDPSKEGTDLDLQTALRTIGQGGPVHLLRQGSHGEEVLSLQSQLAQLGIADAHGHALTPDGTFGQSTREAVQAFQRVHGLTDDGLVGEKTLRALGDAIRLKEASLADRGHPGHPLFCQALEQIHLIDARCGRVPDELSNNLAGSLAVAAQGQGLARIDQVVLGENATRAFAVQGKLDSPFRQLAGVDILQAVATPLAQSSADFRALAPPENAQSPAMSLQQAVAQPAVHDVLR